MKAAIVFVYVVMSAYLMLASVARIAIQLASGQNLDPLPFIGGGLGLVALVLLIPAWEDRKVRSSTSPERADDARTRD